MRAREPICLLTLGVLWIMLSTGASAGVVLERSQVKNALAAAQEKGLATSWLALARRGDFKTLEAQLQAVQDAPAMDAVAKEQALHAFLMGLRRLPPQAVPETLLQGLTGYQAQVFYRHPESRGTYKLPLFDVARVAQGTLRLTRRKRAAAQATALLRQNKAGFWQALDAAESPQQRRGFLDALRQAPLDALHTRRAVLDKAGVATHPEASAILALRLGDAKWAEQVIREAPSRVARLVIEAANSHFPPEEAFGLLKQATLRSPLASTAVGQIGKLAQHSAAARNWLMQQWDDPQIGASAAAALAGLDDGGAVARVIAELQYVSAAAATRNRLLFLHLTGGQSAMAALRRFANNPARPAHLRAEVKRWLGM